MSDGYADAVEYYNGIFNELAENMLGRRQAMEAGSDNAESIGHIQTLYRLKMKHQKLFNSPAFPQAIGLSGLAADFFADRIRPGHCLGVEGWLYVLQQSGRFAQLICLQQATDYRDKLLVFADSKWQITSNGIFYQSPLRFYDGQQDMLLGIAKLRAEKLGLVRSYPMMIIADFHHYRKRYKLNRVWQPVTIKE